MPGDGKNSLFDFSKARGPRRRPDVDAEAHDEAAAQTAAAPMTVSALVGRIKGALADAFPQRVYVVGELSNVKRHTSGHLYFRLKGYTITTRPLREHREDIPLLVSYLLRNRADGRGPRQATGEAVRLLAAHDWPGDVRELRHTIDLLCAVSGSARRIGVQAVQAALGECPPPDGQGTYRSARVEFEEAYFGSLLRRHAGNVASAVPKLAPNRGCISLLHAG